MVQLMAEGHSRSRAYAVADEEMHTCRVCGYRVTKKRRWTDHGWEHRDCKPASPRADQAAIDAAVDDARRRFADLLAEAGLEVPGSNDEITEAEGL
jgi:hypothetical protein